MSQTKYTTPDSRTDVQYQEVKLYLEGIQVPFNSISVNSALGNLPTASISLPPQVGLMEITRFYNPKIHIFFIDPIDGQDKVLFTGILLSSTMQKSADGSASISFNCAHRYQFLSDLLLDYSGWTSNTTNYNVADAPSKPTAPSSKYGVALALTGIFRDETMVAGKKEVTQENVIEDRNDNKTDTSPSIIPSFLKLHKNRFVGVPGVLLNFWNQLKHAAYWTPEDNDVMIKMYIPLVEEGVQFFQRMTGHYYIESLVENDRVDPCVTTPGSEAYNKPRIIPPCMRVFIKSSIQADMGVELAKSAIEFSGELTDLLGVYNRFLNSIDYEMVCINAPAEVVKDPAFDTPSYTPTTQPTYAVDVLIKPQMPFYFAPKCNILFPSMIRSVQVSQDDYSVPTRITLRNEELVDGAARVDTFYRGPASIREAIASFAGINNRGIQRVDPATGTAVNSPTHRAGTRQVINQSTVGPSEFVNVPHQNLLSTLGASHSKVGKYEQGRGVKSEKMFMPNWLKYFSHSNFANGTGTDGWPDQVSDAFNYNAITLLDRGWKRRYGEENTDLNPWQIASGLKAYQRLLVSSVDYYYAMTIARSRSGTVDTIFDPYIVVGYPMDILDGSPNHPSFHAYCTSVTHTITSSSISTSIGFASAVTYTELANYYMPSIHPWLQYVLGLAESQSIVNYVPGQTLKDTDTFSKFGENGVITSPDAKGVANAFYFTSLGVAAIGPTELYDFDTGEVKPLLVQDRGLKPGLTGSFRGPNGGEINPMGTGIGNLSLVFRDIESKELVALRWGINFVDLSPGNYNTNVIRVRNQILAEKDALEPGQSQWLTYDPPFERAPEDSGGET